MSYEDFDDSVPMMDAADDYLFSSQILMENFFEHLEDSDDDLIGELTQDFIEASPLFYQIGSGSASIYADRESNEVSDAIILVEKSRRQNRKYQAEEVTYRARVDPDRLPTSVTGIPMSTIADTVRELFAELLRRTTRGRAPTDLIRVCIQADGLDKPISTSMMSVADLTVEKILSAVMKVLQSKESIELDGGFMVDIIMVHLPVGAGRTNRKVINISVDRLRKQSILTIPFDNEGLCCAKAIVFAIAHLNKDTTAINTLKDRRRPALLNKAKALHEAAGVPQGPCTFAEVAQFEEHLDVQIAVLSSENLNQVSYKGRGRAKRINLWLHDGHYEVVKSLKGFFGSNHYCENCEKPFDHLENHRCADTCYICLRRSCSLGQTVRCRDCDRLCQSEDCFRAHKALTGNLKKSICDTVYQCRGCSKVIRRRDCPQDQHLCGTVKCPSCQNYVIATEHRCFLKKMEPKEPNEKLVFFDFETDQSSGEHTVNFAVAQYADGRETVFRGYTACEDFCSWLFSPKHKGFTAIAHNMKGFDGQFLMGWLLSQGIAPDVIPNGSLLMAIHHRTLDIRVIDSLNFLPMALSQLPSCFGLSELKKGWFPHLFNTRENQDYVGPLPEVKFYSPDTMSPKARDEFLKWHKEHVNEMFHFQNEMEAYCRSDVDILRRCCLEFRRLWLDISDVDPFCYVTIPSACMVAYRSKHMPENTIGMVPVHGYVNRTRHSPDAIRWLDFMSLTQGLQIEHALNSAGEHKIQGVSVDGYCQETKTVYQYQGCFFHGCDTCYDGDSIHPLKGIAMSAVKQKSDETTKSLQEKGYTVVEMWEHEFLRLKKEDPALQEFLETHRIRDRLNPRDAFFGGRTNAIKLFHEGDARYVDFTSLYPWVNKYCLYPSGHPDIITEDFEDIESYFGLVHCRVVPPRGLYLPVLPYRSKKLLFPLCRTCADTKFQGQCCHSDDERALTGTWVTEEVKLAKKKGYLITDIYEVYHFKDTTDSLFRSYIDLFLKIKQESSGWPAECLTEEQRAEYIRKYEERERIKLDAAAISKNPGKRQVAKLALNSLWGRFGMNTNKTQLTFVNTLADFNKMLTDKTKNIKDLYLPTQDVAALQWDQEKSFVAQDSTTNVFVAAFTTAWARLKLYSEMDKLGQAVLYHDTDSIIYATDGLNDPPLGNFLGEFTDELDGQVIKTFVSGGPKNYAYETTSGKTACKIRGFTLNFRNAEKLNFDAMKSMVCSLESDDSVELHNPAKITRDPKRLKVVNRQETKVYRVVYDKRVIQPDLTTLPYGY